jgi:Glycosyltransferase family 87
MADHLSAVPEGRGRSVLLTTGAAFLLVASVLLALARVTSLGSLGDLRLDASASAMSDFRSTIYYPAKAFADGANPYDAKAYLAKYPAPEPLRLYPPGMLLVSLPFAAVPVETAIRIQALLTLLLSGVLAYVSLRLARVRPRPWMVLLIWAIILVSRPGQWNLLQGQATLWVVLGCYAALSLPRRSFLLAGLGLAVAFLKPNFGIPVAALMLARGQLAGAGLGVVIAGVMNLGVLAELAQRAGGLSQLVALLTTGADRLQGPAGRASEFAVFRVDAGGLVTQLLGGHLGLLPSLALGAALVGLVFLLRRTNEDSVQASPPDAAMAGVLCCAVLVSIYHIGYDLLLLAWPFTALVSATWSTPGSRTLRRWALLGLLALLAGNYASTFSVIAALNASGVGLLVLTSLNGVALLALFGLYLREATNPSPVLEPAKVGIRFPRGSTPLSP